jgi:glycosyltransferase involved in cell wall biosynthesis
LKILAYIKSCSPHTIHIHYNSTEFGRSLFPSFLAWFVKIRFPSVHLQVTIHEFANYTLLGKIRHIAPCLIANTCFFSDTNQLNSALKFSNGLIKQKSSIIPIGSNVLYKVTGKPNYIQKGKPIHVVFHGLIQPKNGLDYLVKSIYTLKKQGFPIYLHILGKFALLVNYGEKAEEISEYQQKILQYIQKNLKEETTIHGDIDPSSEKFTKILEKKHIYVCPDTDGITVRRTSFWNVFLQSNCLAVGTYVAGISDPQLSKLVHISPKNTQSITKAIHSLANQPKEEIDTIFYHQLKIKKSMRPEVIEKDIAMLLTR